MITFISITLFFFFNAPAPTEIYTLSLHDALPIWFQMLDFAGPAGAFEAANDQLESPAYRVHVLAADEGVVRSEEHTSELQSLTNLVCRLLLEKKKKKTK